MKCRQLVSKGGEGPVMGPYQTLARHEWSFIGNYASQWSANTFSITHDRRVVYENVISVLEECPVSAKRHGKKSSSHQNGSRVNDVISTPVKLPR